MGSRMAVNHEGAKEGVEGSSRVPSRGLAKHKQQDTGTFRFFAVQGSHSIIVSLSTEQSVEHKHYKVSKCLRCCVDRLSVEECGFIYFHQRWLLPKI